MYMHYYLVWLELVYVDELRTEYTYEEEVQIPSDSDEEDAQSEDLDATIRSLQKLSYLLGKWPSFHIFWVMTGLKEYLLNSL